MQINIVNYSDNLNYKDYLYILLKTIQDAKYYTKNSITYCSSEINEEKNYDLNITILKTSDSKINIMRRISHTDYSYFPIFSSDTQVIHSIFPSLYISNNKVYTYDSKDDIIQSKSSTYIFLGAIVRILLIIAILLCVIII